MESAHEKLDSLSTIEQGGRGCLFVYFELIILPFLVYLYFILGYFGITSIPVHVHSLVLMGIIFFTSLVFARHNAFYGRCFFKNNTGKFNAKLKKYIVKNLVGIGKYKKSNASFEDFVETQSKYIRNDNYASVAASVFPTMGILGTFISIALTMPDFASSQSGELDKEIAILLSGVGTAFYVSIYGIMLSLWWIFFEKLGLSLYDKDVKLIKESTQVFFWTKEELEQSYLKENLGHFKEISSMLGALSNDKFFIKLGQSIEDKFDLFDKMLKLESEVVSVGSKQIKESAKELKIAQEKQQNLGKIHADILKTLQHFSKGLDDMQLKSIESYSHIQNGQKDISKSMEELRKNLSENINKISSLYSTLPQDLQQTQKQILEKFATTLDESVGRFWEESKLASQDRYESLQSVDMDELKDELEQMQEQSAEIMQHMDEIKSDK